MSYVSPVSNGHLPLHHTQYPPINHTQPRMALGAVAGGGEGGIGKEQIKVRLYLRNA